MTETPSQPSQFLTCPGCGGRNQLEAKICEWCGRPFEAPPRRLPLPVRAPPILAFGTVAALAVAVILAGAIALVSLVVTVAGQSGGQRPPEPTAPVTVPSPEADVEPEARPAPPEPTPTGPEFVRVANTGGAGAFIRAEPRAGARGIVAHTDGTILRIVGPDVQSEGRTWRNVEDQRNVRGWTPAEFLAPSDRGF